MEANIFKALRMEQNEVVMCRFLADLLDPKGWHGRETKFLESFMKEFVELEGMTVENVHLERTCIMTEYRIDNGRRIDIMLQNPAFSVPIEAKINARDQRSQCYDYRRYARNAKLIYLTKDGGEPSPWSRKPPDGKEVQEGEIRCVSWGEICNWLKKEPETLEQVSQYVKAVQSFLKRDEKQAADRCSLVRRVLDMFRVEMDRALAGRYNLEALEDSYKSYQNWENESLNFCPRLNYQVQCADSFLKDGLQMWFRIEVAGDGYLSAGFCLVNRKDGGHGTKVKVTNGAVKAVEEVGGLRFILSRDDWWFVWRFSNGKQDVSHDDAPNFKTMNSCAADLLDTTGQPNMEKLAGFVKETVQTFEDQLLGYLKPAFERSWE